MNTQAAISELTQLTTRPQAIDKVRYSHTDMIDFIIAHPGVSQNEIAARYGYSAGWVSRIISSDAFQSSMTLRREEIVDPDLKATLEERFKSLVHASYTRLMQKLEQPQVKDETILRALELGGKFLKLDNTPQVKEPEGARLERLAARLIDLQARVQSGTLITLEPANVEVSSEAR